MKVLLIHNKDITMEYLENILESKCIRGEVIVALPDAFTLEVMRNIHFDMVIGSIHGPSVGMMEDFLAKVKVCENENEIYTYMAVDKETLGTLDQDFLDVVDDFISTPIDKEEFGYRLAKAAKRLTKRNGAETLADQRDSASVSGMPDVSSPEMKLLDSNLQEVSIKDILQSEVIEPENMDSDSLFLSDANFSAMEAESDDVEPEAATRESGPVLVLFESEAEQLKTGVLMIEVQSEPEIEEAETGTEETETEDEETETETEIEEVEVDTKEVEVETEELEVDVETEEVETEAEEIETEIEEIEIEAKTIEAEEDEKEAEVEIIPEPSYDELLKARELRREKEKAESERQERIKWEKIEDAARVISKESIPVVGTATTYGEQVVGASIIVGASSFSAYDSEEEVVSPRGEDADIDDEPSYEELLKAREIRMELEKEESERQETLKWERIEETVEADLQEAVLAGQGEPSYHEQVVRAAISGMPDTVSESYAEPEVLQTERVKREEIPCEPSYEELVREKELRMQKEQEEARRQSMAKKFSGFNQMNEEYGDVEASDPVVHLENLQVEQRLNSKAETIKDEIDLLKHLRKDYNVKTSKVNSAKFKKEKKSIAAKRQKKESKSNGLVAKVTKVFVFLLLVLITTIAILFIKEKLSGGIPVAAGSSIVSVLSDLWIRLWR